MDSYKKIQSGEYVLWQIEMNEIRNGLIGNGIIESYIYNPNSTIKEEDYENHYEYEDAIRDHLSNYCLNKFYDLVLNDKSDNPYIIAAQEEIRNKKTTK